MTARQTTATVLLVDDEAAIRTVFGKELARLGFEVTAAEDAVEARAALNSSTFDVVVLDVRLPGMQGEEFLKEIQARHPGLPVLILTGHANVEMAVQLMREGARDLLTKPCTIRQLSLSIERILESVRLRETTRTLTHFVKAAEEPPEPLFASRAMNEVMELCSRIGRTDEPVLVAGESGVGKELIAHELRRRSVRASGPFIAVNCAAVSSTLLESELFGHEKGAFSGASERRIGFFEMADGGTIFLDEIGDMALEMQAKLLRVLQSGEYWRVGGTRVLRTDARVIAASNKDLEALVTEGRFREDLLYRINTMTIEVPPLRDRPEDIEVLARHFARQVSTAGSRVSITTDAMEALRAWQWPGNVRELRNSIRRAALLCKGEAIEPSDLPPQVVRGGSNVPSRATLTPDATLTLEEVERAHILAALKSCGGNKAKAARSLGIAVKTIYNKLEAWGIDAED